MERIGTKTCLVVGDTHKKKLPGLGSFFLKYY